jgi:ribosome-binding protein aMBF1 (putative translation factor)
LTSGVATQQLPGTYGHMVRFAREKLGLDQTAFAKSIGCSQTMVTDVETGKATFKRDVAVRMYRLSYGWTDWETFMDAERAWEAQRRVEPAKPGRKKKR